MKWKGGRMRVWPSFYVVMCSIITYEEEKLCFVPIVEVL